VSFLFQIYEDLPNPFLLDRIPGKSKVFARVELIDFVSESEADALLSLSPEERNEVLLCLHVNVVALHIYLFCLFGCYIFLKITTWRQLSN